MMSKFLIIGAIAAIAAIMVTAAAGSLSNTINLTVQQKGASPHTDIVSPVNVADVAFREAKLTANNQFFNVIDACKLHFTDATANPLVPYKSPVVMTCKLSTDNHAIIAEGKLLFPVTPDPRAPTDPAKDGSILSSCIYVIPMTQFIAGFGQSGTDPTGAQDTGVDVQKVNDVKVIVEQIQDWDFLNTQGIATGTVNCG